MLQWRRKKRGLSCHTRLRCDRARYLRKGLEKAQALAAKHNVTIKTKVVDLENIKLEANSYDLILCTYFMDRGLYEKIL
ncbi:MAG: hypothetical protein Ct9H300mP23_04590 [Nitrospinota bacterium]|nr:MAG: hypothetical protein Ct9H300mP23_04590 [Nitrospinota bacterium]